MPRVQYDRSKLKAKKTEAAPAKTADASKRKYTKRVASTPVTNWRDDMDLFHGLISALAQTPNELKDALKSKIASVLSRIEPMAAKLEAVEVPVEKAKKNHKVEIPVPAVAAPLPFNPQVPPTSQA